MAIKKYKLLSNKPVEDGCYCCFCRHQWPKQDRSESYKSSPSSDYKHLQIRYKNEKKNS